MKTRRRYREKPGPNQIGIASLHSKERIHDFMKGWGTLCRDGSILWDWWRPPTKKQLERYRNHCGFDKWIFPVIKNMPEFNVKDFLNIQPMI